MATRHFLTICLVAALGACSPEALPYRNPIDRLGAEFSRLGWITYWPCSSPIEDIDFVVNSIPPEDCYRFDAPERMRGVWLLEMEGSTFLPDANASPAVRPFMDDDCTWLEPARDILFSQLPDLKPAQSPPTYLIEFIGRRSTYPSIYGGGGGCPNLVLLDELISARSIEPPPPLNDESRDRAIKLYLANEARLKALEPPETMLNRWILPCPVFICRGPPDPPADRMTD